MIKHNKKERKQWLRRTIKMMNVKGTLEAEADEDELWNGEAQATMFTNDVLIEEMHNPN